MRLAGIHKVWSIQAPRIHSSDIRALDLLRKCPLIRIIGSSSNVWPPNYGEFRLFPADSGLKPNTLRPTPGTLFGVAPEYRTDARRKIEAWRLGYAAQQPGPPHAGGIRAGMIP